MRHHCGVLQRRAGDAGAVPGSHLHAGYAGEAPVQGHAAGSPPDVRQAFRQESGLLQGRPFRRGTSARRGPDDPQPAGTAADLAVPQAEGVPLAGAVASHAVAGRGVPHRAPDRAVFGPEHLQQHFVHGCGEPFQPQRNAAEKDLPRGDRLQRDAVLPQKRGGPHRVPHPPDGQKLYGAGRSVQFQFHPLLFQVLQAGDRAHAARVPEKLAGNGAAHGPAAAP